MLGSTSYLSQFSETLSRTTLTYHAYREPKSPPPPVKPNPPLAPAALKVPYMPALMGPPCPKGTMLVGGGGGASRTLSGVVRGRGSGRRRVDLSGIGIASGVSSIFLGSDFVSPFDSLARIFSVGAA